MLFWTLQTCYHLIATTCCLIQNFHGDRKKKNHLVHTRVHVLIFFLIFLIIICLYVKQSTELCVLIGHYAHPLHKICDGAKLQWIQILSLSSWSVWKVIEEDASERLKANDYGSRRMIQIPFNTLKILSWTARSGHCHTWLLPGNFLLSHNKHADTSM